MVWAVVFVVLGLVGVVLGADWFVKGAAGLARSAGISGLVIGLTVVAFGTSSAELAVSIQAAFTGHADLAVGNVVGSNIANVLLILGFTALMAPVRVALRVIKIDAPLVLAVSVLVWALALDGSLSVLEGGLLFGGLVVHTVWLVVASRRAAQRPERRAGEAGAEADEEPVRPAWQNLIWLVVGLAALVGGADRLVAGASTIARAFGVSELVIGLTVVAVGTSLPELAASVVAARRGQADMALGNIIGSNLFNLLCVLGGTAALTPVSVAPAALAVDLPLMIAVALLTWPLVTSGQVVGRLKGLLMVGLYGGYLFWQVGTSRGFIGPELGQHLVNGALVGAGILAVLAALTVKRGAAPAV